MFLTLIDRIKSPQLYRLSYQPSLLESLRIPLRVFLSGARSVSRVYPGLRGETSLYHEAGSWTYPVGVPRVASGGAS